MSIIPFKSASSARGERRIATTQSDEKEIEAFNEPSSWDYAKQQHLVRDRQWQRGIVRHAKIASYLASFAVLVAPFFYSNFCGGEKLDGWQFIVIVLISALLFLGMWLSIIDIVKRGQP